MVCRSFSAGKQLPAPDLIIGAGQRTHLPLLMAKSAYGGRTIVLMKPSLPSTFFDLCLIPDHDKPPGQNNILSTCGALNTIVPSTNKDPGRGLILIGGPSRHYRWDEASLLAQISRILNEKSVQWTLADSPRTPDSSRQAFKTLARNNLSYKPYADSGRDWLAQQLEHSATTWVSTDSVSMLYEALTSGSKVGLLDVPIKQPSRIVDGIQKLIDAGMLTRFNDWANGIELKYAKAGFNESARCAKLVLQHFSFPTLQS